MSYGQAPLQKPSRIRVVDDVRQSLENAILSGVMRPGERLLETRLADQLGVSRTTVREALLMLVERGLAVGVPRRGTFVTRLSERDALEVRMLRSLLEAMAISAARPYLDPIRLDGLAALLQELYTCELPRDIPRVIEIDRAFHASLVEAADMPRLRDLWASLGGRVGALMLRSIENKNLTLDFLVQLHQDYIAELRSGDPRRMVAAVVHHYVDSQDGEAGDSDGIEQLVEVMALYEGTVQRDWSPSPISPPSDGALSDGVPSDGAFTHLQRSSPS
jgi:DNA-binding GntR family transcriptional regulator